MDENAELGITLDQSSDQVFVEPEPEPEPETAAAAGASPDEEKVGVVPRQVEGGKKYTAGGTTGGGNNRETYNGTFVEGAGDRAGPDFSGAKAAGEEGVHTDDKYYVPEEDIAVFDELCYACGPPARPPAHAVQALSLLPRLPPTLTRARVCQRRGPFAPAPVNRAAVSCRLMIRRMRRCGRPGKMRMKLTKIPHFKEIILMCFSCDTCGYKETDVKPGGDTWCGDKCFAIVPSSSVCVAFSQTFIVWVDPCGDLYKHHVASAEKAPRRAASRRAQAASDLAGDCTAQPSRYPVHAARGWRDGYVARRDQVA